MTVRKRVRRGAHITAKGLTRAVEGNLPKKQLVKILKRGVFSNDPGLRLAVAEDLIALGEFRFLLGMAKKARRNDFSDKAFKQKYKFGELPLDNPQAPWITEKVIERLKAGLKKGPVSKFKGFEVYEMEKLPPGAMLYYGKIVLDKNYPKKLKPVACAHEVGELFGHQIGIAMELVEVKRRNVEKEYIQGIKDSLAWEIDHLRDRIWIIDKHMPDMKGLRKQLMEILKRKPGLQSGP